MSWKDRIRDSLSREAVEAAQQAGVPIDEQELREVLEDRDIREIPKDPRKGS